MSNCIQFMGGTGTVKFTADQLDATAMLADLAKHDGHDSIRLIGNCKDDLGCSLAEFFLNKENVEIDEGTGDSRIAFGEYKSTHTQRDFRATIYYINRFMKTKVEHVFRIVDEYDGFEAVERRVVTFGPDGVVPK